MGPQVFTEDKNPEHPDDAATVFSYSLYYVYYDQYTYITGALCQDILIGLGAVFVAVQMLVRVRIALIIALVCFISFI